MPTILAQVERPGTPLVTRLRASELGFKLALRGVTVLNAQVCTYEAPLFETPLFLLSGDCIRLCIRIFPPQRHRIQCKGVSPFV